MTENERDSAARDGNTDAGRASHVWTCRGCGSHRWVSISLNGGVTCKRQCVPCGKVAEVRP